MALIIYLAYAIQLLSFNFQVLLELSRLARSNTPMNGGPQCHPTMKNEGESVELFSKVHTWYDNDPSQHVRNKSN